MGLAWFVWGTPKWGCHSHRTSNRGRTFLFNLYLLRIFTRECVESDSSPPARRWIRIWHPILWRSSAQEESEADSEKKSEELSPQEALQLASGFEAAPTRGCKDDEYRAAVYSLWLGDRLGVENSPAMKKGSRTRATSASCKLLNRTLQRLWAHSKVFQRRNICE
jgi:hypothetical protein